MTDAYIHDSFMSVKKLWKLMVVFINDETAWFKQSIKIFLFGCHCIINKIVNKAKQKIQIALHVLNQNNSTSEYIMKKKLLADNNDQNAKEL